MKLILTRHGRTFENEMGIHQGHSHGRLSEEGLSQARKVAKRLSYEHIDYIYSSDLGRAADTAREIAKHHSSTHLIFVKELRETDLGSWTGKKYSEADYSNIPPDVESAESLIKRAGSFFEKTLKKHRDETVLFVGHNGINTALILYITGRGAEDFDRLERLHNTGISVFVIDNDKKCTVKLFNCIKHLEE